MSRCATCGTFALSSNQARAIEIITTGSIFLAIILLICAALLAVAMYWREQTLDALLDVRMFSWAHVFIEDLHRIGHSRYLYFSAAVSIPYLLIQIVPIYAIMQAYGFDGVKWAQAGALMILLRLGSVVPQAPGNVGLFQVLSTLGLTLFGVPGSDGAPLHRYFVGRRDTALVDRRVCRVGRLRLEDGRHSARSSGRDARAARRTGEELTAGRDALAK